MGLNRFGMGLGKFEAVKVYVNNWICLDLCGSDWAEVLRFGLGNNGRCWFGQRLFCGFDLGMVSGLREIGWWYGCRPSRVWPVRRGGKGRGVGWERATGLCFSFSFFVFVFIINFVNIFYFINYF